MNKIFTGVKALILRESAYREDDKILTLLTAETGKISVRAQRARRSSSKLAAATQHLAYCDFVLFSNKGGYKVNESSAIELFNNIRTDIEKFALASYFAELLETVCEENAQGGELLSLALNSLFALNTGFRAPEIVKSVFELRIMSLSGFSPLLDKCCNCGADTAKTWTFGIDAGNIWCKNCGNEASGESVVPVSSPVLAAMRHIVYCPPKRILAFSLDPEYQPALFYITQKFLHYHLNLRFGALDFYNKIIT